MARPARDAPHPTFSARTFGFLRELADNNNREWFQRNKEQYETLVRDPALRFIASMAPGLHSISPRFDAVAKRSGGSLMRVHRDTRFSHDKTPYKTNIGIQFRHERGRDVHAPGFYLHIEPGSCFVGAGIWHPETSVLRAIRMEIVEHPDAWRRASRTKRFTDYFALCGESLMRPPQGFPAAHRYVDDLKRKDFIAIAPLKDRELQTPALAETLTGLLRRTAPLMAFLCAAIDLDY
jgi:uncharacterized protein (TIGR02453 family)